jgi:hypothetical protein
MSEIIIHEESGLVKDKAQEIEAAFTPAVEAMKEMLPVVESFLEQYSGKVPDEETIEEAKEWRLKLVKVRTGTAKAHKEQKAPFLKAGKFIDGLKNAQLKASTVFEDGLRAIEEHHFNVEKQRLQDIQIERVEQISPYTGEGTDMANKYLNNAKHEFENPVKEAEPWTEEQLIDLIQWVWAEARADNEVNLEDAGSLLKEYITEQNDTHA